MKQEAWTAEDVKIWRARVGQRIKGKKLTQAEAAERIGYHKRAIQKMEAGHPVQRVAQLAMIAIDAVTWCEAENFPAPPALRALLSEPEARNLSLA